MEILIAGANGDVPETPKKEKIKNYIIANNGLCLQEMKLKAENMGYNVKQMTVFGNIKEAVKKILDNIPKEKQSCLIFGGETTVEVIGKGSGGRNRNNFV